MNATTHTTEMTTLTAAWEKALQMGAYGDENACTNYLKTVRRVREHDHNHSIEESTVNAITPTVDTYPVITAADIMCAYHGMSDYELDGLARSMSSSEDGTRRQAAAFGAQLEAEGWRLSFDGDDRPVITDADGDIIDDAAWLDVMGRGLDALADAEQHDFTPREWEPGRDPLSAAPSWCLLGILRDLDARDDDGEMRIVDSNHEIWRPDVLLDAMLDGEILDHEDPTYTMDEYTLSWDAISRVRPDGTTRPEYWITTLEKLMAESADA